MNPVIIEQYNLDEEFICNYDSLKEAAIYIDINPGTLCKHIQNNKPCKGFIWKYARDLKIEEFE